MPGILNRLALLVLSLTTVASTVRAGEVTSDDWSSLLNSIRTESWSSVADLSWSIMGRLPECASDERARLRYTYLFALSGEVIAGELSHADFSARIATMIGERLIFPERIIADPSMNGPMFNQIAKADVDGRVMMIASNADASSVHSFEYAKLAAPFDLSASVGNRAIVSGTLAAIDANADGATAWAARMYIDDAIIYPVHIPTVSTPHS